MLETTIHSIQDGNNYLFDTKGADEHLSAYDGQVCTVVRKVLFAGDSVDPSEPAYWVRFADGSATFAFADELNPV